MLLPWHNSCLRPCPERSPTHAVPRVTVIMATTQPALTCECTVMVSEILKWIRNSRFHSIRTAQFATVERKARSYVYEMASYKGQFCVAPKNRNKSSLTIQRPTVITFMRKQRRGLNGQVCQQNSTHSKADGGAPRFHTLTNERGQRGIT